MIRYIIKNNHLTDAEINTVNNETDNTFKKSSNDCMKTPTETEYNKLREKSASN